MKLIYLSCAWVVGTFLGLCFNLTPFLIFIGLIPLPFFFIVHKHRKFIILLSICTVILLSGAVRSQLSLPAFDANHLRFYNDHTAAKGYLYLRGAGSKRNFAKYQRDGRAIRSGTDGPQPIDEAMLTRLRDIVTRYVNNVRQNSPLRVAYALDDEISWGSFVVPIPWRLNADDDANSDISAGDESDGFEILPPGPAHGESPDA